MSRYQYPEEGEARSRALVASAQPARSGQVTADAAVRLPRQSLDATREDLLEAATQIVNEYFTDVEAGIRVPLDPLPFVRIDDVLNVASEIARERLEKRGKIRPNERVAPLTAGAFYKAFADDSGNSESTGRGAVLTTFRRLVAQRIVTDPILANASLYVKLGLELHARGRPWSEVVRIGAHIEFERWMKSPALALIGSLAAHGQEVKIAAWLKEADGRNRAELSQLYSRLLDLYGRRMRNGLTVDHMAVAVSDAIAGMALNARYSAASRDLNVDVSIDGTEPQRWPLCSVVAWSIYSGLTEELSPRQSP